MVEDPIAALVADYEGDDVGLPADVFDAGESYPVARFSLTEKGQKDLRSLCRLLGIEPEQFMVRFGREAIEQATALEAARASAQGWHHVIVGQDVADELAGQYIAACLKTQRAVARREREQGTASGAAAADADGEHGGPERGGAQGAAPPRARGRAGAAPAGDHLRPQARRRGAQASRAPEGRRARPEDHRRDRLQRRAGPDRGPRRPLRVPRLAPGDRVQGRHAQDRELRKYTEPIVSGVSCVIAHRTIVIDEPHQARILDSARLVLRSWKNDPSDQLPSSGTSKS